MILGLFCSLLSPVQLFKTPWTVTSSVHSILLTRILEWVATSFSRRSFRTRDQTKSLAIQEDSLPLSHQRAPLLFKHIYIYNFRFSSYSKSFIIVKYSLFLVMIPVLSLYCLISVRLLLFSFCSLFACGTFFILLLSAYSDLNLKRDWQDGLK